MVKLTKKIFDSFIDVIPTSDTYFIKKEVPDIKLTKDIVRLNYGIYSPFGNSDLVFYKDKENLYIWFTKNKLKEKKIYVPEGFLAYLAYINKFSKDGIVIKKIEDKYLIIVVKNMSITAQILSKNKDEAFVDMLNKEYSLSNPEIFEISNEDKLYIDYSSLLKFFNSIDFSLENILKELYEQIKVPIIVFLILINVFDVFLYKYVSVLVNNKRIELSELENNNKKIKKDFLALENASKFWENFANNELQYPNLYNVLSAVSKAVAENRGNITIFRKSGNLINMWVVSKSTTSIVNSLVSSKFFYDIQVLSTSRYYKDKTKEVGELEFRVRAKKYGG